MSSQTGKWETVVNKKKGHVTKADVKKAQKKLIEGESVPKIQSRDPIELDANMYADAFADSNSGHIEDSDHKLEKVPSRIPFDSDHSKSVEQGESRSPRNQPRKKEKKQKPPPPVFDVKGAIQKLDVGALRVRIDEVKGKFPNHPLIWLKEVASWLHLHLAGPADKDLAYLKEAQDYPSCYLPSELKALLSQLLLECPRSAVGTFLVGVTSTLVSEAQQGHGTIAERLLIQAVARTHSPVFLDQCDEIVLGKSRNSDAYLAVIWTLSQFTSNLQDGIKVWWTAMFDTLKAKAHAEASIRYLQKLLRMHKHDGEAFLEVEQFCQLLEAMYSSRSPLSLWTSLKSDLSDLCPQLLGFVLNEKSARKCFIHFLTRLKTEADLEMKKQICMQLVTCMTTSSSCLQWWLENILGHLKESSVLLRHIQVDGDYVSTQMKRCGRYVEKDPLAHGASSMLQTMEAANEKGKYEKKAGFRECRNVCLSLIRGQEKVKRGGWTIRRFLKVLLALLLCFVAADVYRSGGWKHSKTGQFAKSRGIEDRTVVLLGYANVAVEKISGLCTAYAPSVCQKLHAVLTPVMETSWHYIIVSSKFIYRTAQPGLDYVNQVAPPMLDKLTDALVNCYAYAAALVSDLWSTYWPVVEKSLSAVYEWLSVNVPLAFMYVYSQGRFFASRVYELSPDTFDRLYVLACDAWAYIMATAPLVFDKVTSSVCQLYSHGKSWLHQTVSSTPSAATA